jgi:hypothetical protein
MTCLIVITTKLVTEISVKYIIKYKSSVFYKIFIKYMIIIVILDNMFIHNKLY